MQNKAKRFDINKNRLDLIPPSLLEEVGKILTFGAEKYGDSNWKLGMKWSRCIGSLKRHLLEFEKGIDYDNESGELHISHILTNAAFLLEYYKIYPQGDDRGHWYNKPFKRVYMDLDGVLVDFENSFLEYMDLPLYPSSDWNDWRFRENMHKVEKNDNFWLNCKPLIDPKQITYPIMGYCTSRPCSIEVIYNWLKKYNFPTGEIINVGFNTSKVDALKGKCDFFIDDSIKIFSELNSNGIKTYLMTRPHNIKYDVGYMRVNKIEDFFNLLK